MREGKLIYLKSPKQSAEGDVAALLRERDLDVDKVQRVLSAGETDGRTTALYITSKGKAKTAYIQCETEVEGEEIRVKRIYIRVINGWPVT
jgi:hypothetical protein